MRRPQAPLRIVSIGGGTGLSSLHHGLKDYVCPPGTKSPEIVVTAVVTVTDDGGSSGRLRRDFDVLPPGDIRNCMVALSEDGALLSRLFQYRFESGRGLKGHSFGNLFLTALAHITGDFSEAVKQSSEVLKISGKIYPSTSANVRLEALLEDGTLVRGETKISQSRRRIEEIRLQPRCRPVPDAIKAIAEADLITFGPGSLFTSVIPNLLVAGIPRAIRESKAAKAYFVNLMWQPGETVSFSGSDHIEAIHKHARGPLIDYAVLNTSPIRAALKKRYAREQMQPVENDLESIRNMGIQIVKANLLRKGTVARHDPAAIAAVAVKLAQDGRKRRTESKHAK